MGIVIMHTPRPWALVDHTVIGGPDEQSIAELCNRLHSSMTPNGHLIAAAPDLLEAARAALECYARICPECIQGLGVAIAKAEGRS